MATGKRRRRDRGLAVVSGGPEPPGSPLEGEEIEWTKNVIPLSDHDRVRTALGYGRHRQLVDFVIQQEIRIDGRWRSVRRYDLEHGRFHVDIYSRRGGRPKKVWLEESLTTDDACEEAETQIFDHWEEHRRTFCDA